MQTLAVLLTQVALPAGLLLWFLLSPPNSRVGLLLTALGILLFLVAAARLLLWSFLPWWLPWLYVGTWMLVLAYHLLAQPLADRPLLPAGWRQWLDLAGGAALAVVGVWGLLQVRAAGAPPPEVPVVDLPNPLGPGHYLVGHAGVTGLLNHHVGTLDPSVERFRDWRAQSYALDIVGINVMGTHASGWSPREPQRYAIFGAPLHAPCDATVRQVENDMPDLPVPERDRERLMGNHVLLQCGPDLVVVLAHLRRGSVQVSAGEQVLAGEFIAEVGNSGNTTEPHLHIHAQRPGSASAPLNAEPLLLTLDGRLPLRNARLRGTEW